MQEDFGRYTLGRRLAVGGMAEIFLAHLHGDAGFEKKVVVKRILPHFGADGDFVKMFIDEAVLAARLSHPNLVQVYDFGSVNGSYFIAMEYIEGVDLHHLLRQCQETKRLLSPAEVAVIGEQIARGLSYTHNLTNEDGTPLGIVHRDVSPHNLMLSTAGSAKVMDFGIAKAAARFSRTATGTIKGKLAYMAPEQAAGESATKFSDQFALGVVLWECLTGQRLFSSDTEVSLMQNVIACDVPTIRSKRPDVPAALEAIVMRALSKERSARYPDLHEMEADLTGFRFALGADGIVQLGDLATEFALSEDEVARSDWSYAAQQAPAGGTRPIQGRTPPPRRPTAPPRNATPTPNRRRGTSRGLTPARRRTAPPAAAALRHRTTLRIDRTGEQRRFRLLDGRVLLSGAVLILLGIGFPLALWTTATQSSALAAFRHEETAEPHWDAPQPSGRGGAGRLALRSNGPALDVYLGNQLLGRTPLHDINVPAGNVQLRLVNEAAHIWRNYEIYVPEGGSAQGTIAPK